MLVNISGSFFGKDHSPGWSFYWQANQKRVIEQKARLSMTLTSDQISLLSTRYCGSTESGIIATNSTKVRG